MKGTYVSAMLSNPPPAPATACATLSLCCAAVLVGTEAVDSASFCCAVSVETRDMLLECVVKIEK
jgi:hypothetical protein